MYHSIMAKRGTTFPAMSLLWYITEHDGWEFLNLSCTFLNGPGITCDRK